MDQVTEVNFKGELKEAVKASLKKLGGIKSFVKQGEVVLLKPNFNTADPFPASTDLSFLKAVVQLVYEAGPKIVMVGGSSTMSLNTRSVMNKLGVFDLEKMSPPPRVYNFDERGWVKKRVPEAEYLKKVSISEYVDKADRIILLPCLKTHCQAQFTGSLKLSVGFMRPRERVGLHLSHIQEKIAELNKIIPADLAIMDARTCFINRGPSHGERREPNLILASKDRVALDMRGVEIIQGFEGSSLEGIEPKELVQIKRARELGVGGVSN